MRLTGISLCSVSSSDILQLYPTINNDWHEADTRNLALVRVHKLSLVRHSLQLTVNDNKKTNQKATDSIQPSTITEPGFFSTPRRRGFQPHIPSTIPVTTSAWTYTIQAVLLWQTAALFPKEFPPCSEMSRSSRNAFHQKIPRFPYTYTHSLRSRSITVRSSRSKKTDLVPTVASS